jgi:SAM-dependent methyltransferase
MLKENEDAFGREIYDFQIGKNPSEVVERDDGYIGASGAYPTQYFAEFENWVEHEQEAMQFARGRILDIGCGAGRVGLYLQSKGHQVLGIDNSPLALEVCRQRGIANVQLMSITQINRQLGEFETIVMYGNNFGLFGSPDRARHLLRHIHRLTTPQGRILASSRNVYQTDDPDHLSYHQLNRERGRMAGQTRLRVRYKKIKSPWFDYLMVSPDEMADILKGTGWYIHRLCAQEDNPAYTAVLFKEGYSE